MEKWVIGIVLLLSFLWVLKIYFSYRKVAVRTEGYNQRLAVILLLFASMAFIGISSISDTLTKYIFSSLGIQISEQSPLIALAVFFILATATVLIMKQAPNITNITTLNLNSPIERSATNKSPESLLKTGNGLPRTNNSKLFGRTKELSKLTRAWNNNKINIVVIKAMGGVGKTALLNEWLDGFNDSNDYYGAKKIHVYSFYSQGSVGGEQASADEFFEEALSDFGYKGDNNISARSKGLELAKLVSQNKALLVLDGLEPLQYPVDILNGEVIDKGLGTLLIQLADSNKGLCIVSSRRDVVEIKDKPLVISNHLDRLETKDGAKLLTFIGVRGKQSELERAVDEMEGHALALNLLGSFVVNAYDGDIRQRDKIPSIYNDPLNGGHAKNVMLAYENHLKNTQELHVLYLLALFSRPPTKDAFEILSKKLVGNTQSKIGELFKRQDKQRLKFTKKYQELPDVEKGYVFNNLRKNYLLNSEDLSLHPLVSEYFEERLKQKYFEVWQQSHRQLYRYYKNIPEDDKPKTLGELEPLFEAVIHGCAAGLYNEANYEVYQLRIQNEYENHLSSKLGAYGIELTILSSFFKRHWDEPVEELDDAFKADILNGAGVCLRALGRYQEAELPIKVVLNWSEKQEFWDRASGNSGSLSTLQLIQGNISDALETAKRSLEFAEKIIDKDKCLQRRLLSHTTMAHTYHQLGDMLSAKSHFLIAEGLQKKMQPDHPQLYSSWGFNYCNLLISEGQWEEVRRRAKQNLEWWSNDFKNGDLFVLALDPLSHSRATLMFIISKILKNCSYKNVLKIKANDIPTDSLVLVLGKFGLSIPEGSKPLMKLTLDGFNRTVDGLHSAGAEEFIIQGLLARAKYYRYCLSFNYQEDFDAFEEAKKDLKESYNITQFGEMKLFLIDYHLESASLALTVSKSVFDKTAFAHTQIAKQLVEETGYNRRTPELEYLELHITELSMQAT